jgi:dihydrofolate reductase
LKKKKMRTLKLQMQTSIDGFVGPSADGVGFTWDKEAQDFSVDNLQNVDTVLLAGIADPFISHWGQVAANPKQPDHVFANTMMKIPRVVFSNKHKTNKWENTSLIGGDFAKEIAALKKKEGKGIIVYGGRSFASSLIRFDLVDEFCFLVNPFAAGEGEPIFDALKARLPMLPDPSPNTRWHSVKLAGRS